MQNLRLNVRFEITEMTRDCSFLKRLDLIVTDCLEEIATHTHSVHTLYQCGSHRDWRFSGRLFTLSYSLSYKTFCQAENTLHNTLQLQEITL